MIYARSLYLDIGSENVTNFSLFTLSPFMVFALFGIVCHFDFLMLSKQRLLYGYVDVYLTNMSNGLLIHNHNTHTHITYSQKYLKWFGLRSGMSISVSIAFWGYLIFEFRKWIVDWSYHIWKIFFFVIWIVVISLYIRLFENVCRSRPIFLSLLEQLRFQWVMKRKCWPIPILKLTND